MINLGTVKLHSKRLFLRKFELKDLEKLCDSYINQKEFLYYANKTEKTKAEIQEWLKAKNLQYVNDDYYDWVILLQNTIIGSINLKIVDDDTVQFNYAIDNRYVNNGYMTEALTIIKDFCMNKLKVKKFQGACCVENIASKRVMEKCDLELVEVLDDYIKLKDGYHDSYLFVKKNV